MQQLKPLDAAMLLADRPNAPMNGTTVWIYDRSTVPGGKLDFAEVFEHLRVRVRLLPVLCKKLLRVPGGIDHPWWIDDAHFDLEYHVRHIALPPPGDWQQFWVQTARVHARPLDLTRPLWELYMIDGLDNLEGVPPGAFALVLKVHHAAVDGRTAMTITEVINSDAVVDDEAMPPAERTPSRWELIARSAYHGAMYPRRAARALQQLAPLVPSGVSSASRSPTSMTLAPQTRFSGAVSPHRVLDAVFVDLADVQGIRRVVDGATVNDVALAVFGGALRAYLRELGELPDLPMRALTPVALRARADPDSIGNQLSFRIVTLATDVADPGERLVAITAASIAAKAAANASLPDLGDPLDFVPTVLLAPSVRLISPLARRGASAFFNTVVSNVAAPGQHLYLRGAKLALVSGGAPVSDGIGLINYLQSYAGKAMFGFTSCRQMMPDPQRYAECIRQSLDDLMAVPAPGDSSGVQGGH